ncbi:MAG: flagellum-specific ATP synthase FliI, partial [Devosia sp.]
VRGILDGHIVMERQIAERGRYPAVNVLRSISRTMPGCVPVQTRPLLQKARELMSVFSDMEELIRLGAYRKGSDPKVDRAISIYPALEAFLSQQREERTSIADGYTMLGAIVDKAGGDPA